MKELINQIKKMFAGKETQMMTRSVKYDELLRMLEAAEKKAPEKTDGKK